MEKLAQLQSTDKDEEKENMGEKREAQATEEMDIEPRTH
jgi:hypothetical protein